MAGFRDRFRRPARATGRLEAGRRILVVCEGAVTEVQYINGLRDHCKNSLVEIQIHRAAGVPRTLVERAKELRDEAANQAKRAKDDYLRYDEVWCVFDVDSHPRVPEARDMAAANGLLLGMSNPCFELWLLLHLRDPPGPQHRSVVQDMLKCLMPGVAEKHVDLPRVLPGYEQAIAHARRLEREANEASDPNRNPTTEVYRLANSIDEDGKSRRSAQLKRRDEDSRAKAAAAQSTAEDLLSSQREDGDV